MPPAFKCVTIRLPRCLQQAITAKPGPGYPLYFTLGDAQTGQKKYDDAAVSYQKAIDLNDASKKPNPDLDSASYNNLGQGEGEPGQATGRYCCL